MNFPELSLEQKKRLQSRVYPDEYWVNSKRLSTLNHQFNTWQEFGDCWEFILDESRHPGWGFIGFYKHVKKHFHFDWEDKFSQWFNNNLMPLLADFLEGREGDDIT